MLFRSHLVSCELRKKRLLLRVVISMNGGRDASNASLGRVLNACDSLSHKCGLFSFLYAELLLEEVATRLNDVTLVCHH